VHSRRHSATLQGCGAPRASQARQARSVTAPQAPARGCRTRGGPADLHCRVERRKVGARREAELPAPFPAYCELAPGPRESWARGATAGRKGRLLVRGLGRINAGHIGPKAAPTHPVRALGPRPRNGACCAPPRAPQSGPLGPRPRNGACCAPPAPRGPLQTSRNGRGACLEQHALELRRRHFARDVLAQRRGVHAHIVVKVQQNVIPTAPQRLADTRARRQRPRRAGPPAGLPPADSPERRERGRGRRRGRCRGSCRRA
jgi:hypothetical protein